MVLHPELITPFVKSFPVFNILFLSEGFRKEEEVEFDGICRFLADELLKFTPYSLVKDKIAIWMHFMPTPNNKEFDGTEQSADNGETVFGFYYRTLALSSHVDLKSPRTIIEKIKEVEVYLPSQGYVPGADIWLNFATKGKRVVCVICRSHKSGSLTFADPSLKEWLQYNSTKPPDDRFDPTEAHNLIKFIGLATWPIIHVIRGGYPQPDPNTPYGNNNIYSQWQEFFSVFVHELGHIFDLADEYELWDKSMPLNSQEPLAPNVTLAKSVVYGTTLDVDVNKIKWRDLISVDRLNRTKSPIKQKIHPDVDAPDSEYFTILYEGMKKIIALDHPKTLIDGVMTNQPLCLSYHEDSVKELMGEIQKKGKRVLYHLKPNLIEGGMGLSTGVFRPTPEKCLMRSRGNQFDPIFINGTLDSMEFRIYDYCPVCLNHVTKMVANDYNPKILDIKIIPGPPQIYNFKFRSRLADKFIQHVVEKGSLYSNGNSSNAEVLYQYYLSFFEKIKWSKNKFYPMFGLLVPGWNVTKVKYPIQIKILNDPYLLHHLWINDLKNQRDYRNILKIFVAMGAVGTMLLSGFGSLFNLCKTEMHHNGSNISFYPLLEGLQKSELDNLYPGSLLQIWPSKNHYEQSVRYVTKIIDGPKCMKEINDNESNPNLKANLDPATNSPRVPNESLIFMGKDDNGVYRVADNQGIQRDLESDWKEYAFWIGAQWHDVVRIP